MRAVQKLSVKKKSYRKRTNRKNITTYNAEHLPVPRRFRRFKSENKPTKQIILTKKRDYIRRFLPSDIRYLIETKNSPFYLKEISKEEYKTSGRVFIPSNFSIIDNATESFNTIKKIIHGLLLEDLNILTLDYIHCKTTELSTQVLLDIILKDFTKFKKIYTKIFPRDISLFPRFGGENIKNDELREMMWSVGSPATLGIGKRKYKNVVEYPLRTYSIEKNQSEIKRMERKELDTTELVDYVIASLDKINKRLTSEKLDDLCTVIGEILINAEEHSTTNKRFSIGFFRECTNDNNHYGIFRLVILNFGKTIYEKFKSEDCPNKDIVLKMKELSDKYTKKLFFLKGKFEEETLWTLYALQEGVTSISTKEYKRGNGSIRFIESFFNLKENSIADNISKMTLLSGGTKIIFDGKYSIMKKSTGDEQFKVMTFNNNGNIEDKPDSKYVCYTPYYFPGTMYSVKLLFNNDDIKQINK